MPGAVWERQVVERSARGGHWPPGGPPPGGRGGAGPDRKGAGGTGGPPPGKPGVRTRSADVKVDDLLPPKVEIVRVDKSKLPKVTVKVKANGSAPGQPVTTANYGPAADGLRRDLRVAQVRCLAATAPSPGS